MRCSAVFLVGVALAALCCLSSNASAQSYSQFTICSSSSRSVSYDSFSSASAANEIISHAGVGSHAHSEPLSCTTRLYSSGSASSVAVVLAAIDIASASMQVSVGSQSSEFMNIDQVYEGSSITLTYTGSAGSGGFRASVFGVPASPDTNLICSQSSLSRTAAGQLLSHAEAGISGYSNNVDCTTLLPYASGYKLIGHFVHYSLESCCDRVYVGADQVSDSTDIVVDSAESMRFRTDGSVTSTGFVFRYFLVHTSELPSSNVEYTTHSICDGGTLTNMYGQIVSQFGSSYDNNIDCTVYISAPSGYSIAIETSSYEVESCCDRLTIEGGSTTYTSFYAGFATTIASNYVSINFDTDGSVTRSGFVINYQLVSSAGSTVDWSEFDGARTSEPATTTTTLPIPISDERYTVCSTSSITGAAAGVIFSHRNYGSNNYDDNLNCAVVLYPLNNDEFVHIYVDSLDLESYDRVNVITETSSMQLTSSGQSFIGGIGESVRITFTSDSSVTREGFKLLFQSSESAFTVLLDWDTISGAVSDPGGGGGSGSSFNFPVGAIPGIIIFCIFFLSFTISACTKAMRGRPRQRVVIRQNQGAPLRLTRTTNTTTNNNNNNNREEEHLPTYAEMQASAAADTTTNSTTTNNNTTSTTPATDTTTATSPVTALSFIPPPPPPPATSSTPGATLYPPPPPTTTTASSGATLGASLYPPPPPSTSTATTTAPSMYPPPPPTASTYTPSTYTPSTYTPSTYTPSTYTPTRLTVTSSTTASTSPSPQPPDTNPTTTTTTTTTATSSATASAPPALYSDAPPSYGDLFPGDSNA